jgi:hypothetical protein
MAKLKAGKPEDQDARIEDPVILQDAFQQLFDAETEFPIQVEGTHTLPYFATVKTLHWEEGHLILKLVRPLPHELLVGAVFHFLCAAGEQRYEGFIKFMGREGYLQYRFERPAFLMLSDRRNHKRYPFRPRESAYVILQDSGIPGLGVAGPLVNIGMGGLAMRVDRVIRLDTGYRTPPSTALFERGKGFTRVRIQDLPRVHLVEARGVAAHALDRGSEVILGISFAGIQEEEQVAIRTALDVRDRMQRGGQAGRPVEGGPVSLRGGEGLAPGETEPLSAEPATVEGRLLGALRRRTALVALVMPPSEAREALDARLQESGFHRRILADDLAGLTAQVAGEPRRHVPRVCVVDLAVAHAGDAEPLEAVRSIEAGIAAAMGAVPVVILCDAVDPTLLLAQADNTRFLSPELTEESLATLDRLLDRDG